MPRPRPVRCAWWQVKREALARFTQGKTGGASVCGYTAPAPDHNERTIFIMAIENSKLDMDATNMLENLRTIRHALHIGLESYGEIERLTDVFSLYKDAAQDLPDHMRPIHPTGSNDTIGVFSAALRTLELFDPTDK